MAQRKERRGVAKVKKGAEVVPVLIAMFITRSASDIRSHASTIEGTMPVPCPTSAESSPTKYQ
jgi:hypothetical protein